jgi:hypothetical protein
LSVRRQAAPFSRAASKSCWLITDAIYLVLQFSCSFLASGIWLLYAARAPIDLPTENHFGPRAIAREGKTKV